ncbi:MAG TPA: RNA methyltransferase [Candidatus Ruania gallistercoris]|uniref:RNA methyltransferase n=1 Tax=Candidatus Ruania gallistercoris TaxID=2838746 RepID=A0A9D2EBJ5_9MICO|nr:RNA methyltransferase [Candidatus Ruania gallistercoris]
MTDVALRRTLEVERGLFMAESSTVIRRAVAAGHRPRSFLMAPKWLPDLEDLLQQVGAGEHGEIPVYLAEEDVLRTITGFHLHRGALAAMHRPVLPEVADLLPGTGRSRVAILEGLVDHTNVGACFRSAAAMGVDAVLVTPTCADPLYRRSVRVSMGTVFQVPWTRIENWPAGIQQLKDDGYVVAGMTLGEGAITLDDLVAQDHEHLALILGSEGHGLMATTERALDRRVTIPMMGGVDSLNVAASSAVAFYATR